MLFPTIVYYCILLYSAFSHKDSPCMLLQIQFCVCMCVLDIRICVCMHAHAYMYLHYVCDNYNTQNGMEPIWGLLYVTGFWKTDQIVTLGLFHFIGQTNGYTRTLHIHSVSIRLGWLVCFYRATFADSVNSWLRQWDPWRALHGRHGPEIHPRDRETSITPFTHVWAYCWLFWDS